ncbi:peptidase domain-containing ABC transporter [Arenimonas composti]|uniref:peptidase domain-containing ABC transporter n=1 Tax=Arenimonas composti TaxID=370776 RepID=UPI0004080BFA|nr:peptidase domain-containing ABC transporter [Arenimonas composti]
MEAIRQSAVGECGLACLAMVAEHHGHRIGLPALRQRFPLSLKGASLARLVAIAGALGLQARALRLEPAQLRELKLPCVLHWNLDHYVVLEKVGRRGLRILDPALGRRHVDADEVARRFTGVALELTPAAAFAPRAAPPPLRLRQLLGRVAGGLRALGLLLALSLALQVFVLLAPMQLQWIVDHALVAADRELLAVIALGFALLLALQVGVGLLRGWTLVALAAALGRQWTGNVLAHALRLPLDFFQKRHLGDVVSRLGAVQAIQRTLTTGFVEALVDGVLAVATATMMLLYSPKLAAIGFLAVALYLAARMTAFPHLREANERQLEAAASQQGHLLESLRGIQSLKVAGQEPARAAQYRSLVVDTLNRELRLATFGLGFSSGQQLLFGGERVLVIWLGAGLVLDGGFSVGMLLAYLAWKDQFAARTATLVDRLVELRMLRLHGERLADIVLAEPEHDPASDFEQAPASLRIEVRELGFRYADGEPWVLRGCSFHVDEGETVAIVGASGGGKTTLLKLVLGLLSPEEGRVLVGGRDLRRLGARNFRAQVGVVMQDDQLFAGSIADNIALGDDRVDMVRVEAAARAAAVHDEIAAMPMGYHSLIGDMGSALSGGQKQRVILARALYRQPRLLVLDEATSHLDVGNEQRVNAAIRQLRIGKLIVAHRPETIAAADRVLVLHGGRIVQEARPGLPPGPPARAAPEAASPVPTG